MRPLIWLTVVSLVPLVACRRLPGPTECQRVAAGLLGLEDLRLLSDPRVKAEFDQLTRDCLLTPYDAELVRCVDETVHFRQCVVEFKRRRESAALADQEQGSDRNSSEGQTDRGSDRDGAVRRW